MYVEYFSIRLLILFGVRSIFRCIFELLALVTKKHTQKTIGCFFCILIYIFSMVSIPVHVPTYYTMIQWPYHCQSSITSHSGGLRDKLTLGFVCQQDCCRTSVGLSQTSISPTSLPKFALSISVCLLYHDVMGLNVVSVCACHRLTRALSGCRCMCFNISSLKVVSTESGPPP